MSSIEERYAAGASLPQLSRETGIPVSTIRHRLLRAGVTLRSRTDGVRIADGLGSGTRGKTRAFTPEWKANISTARLKHGEANAKGVRLTKAGYLEFTRGPHKGRLAHVVIAEQALGRRLAPDEHVHHRDHNKTNNDPGNLQVMSRADHARLHRLAESAEGKIKRDNHGRFSQ